MPPPLKVTTCFCNACRIFGTRVSGVAMGGNTHCAGAADSPEVIDGCVGATLARHDLRLVPARAACLQKTCSTMYSTSRLYNTAPATCSHWLLGEAGPVLEMVSKPKNAVGDRHLARKSMHLARNLEFGRSHQMSVVACSNASSAECNISVYFFPVPSTRCAHHACSNLIYSCFHSNIHALGVFLVCISWIRVGYST